ncbi:response regulator transcription factor [Dehalogenimonas alkenigignens]|uniref:Response regulators consisting of a CheY-like receiver domain and a winged-helix DNA-binding domain n=1 Tax=Dehalogenimonas alkenigignens TaxID=1217799 RepID=A0A0W0GIN3_9CHLR|nr:response regulator transcription factor [Dehalogenimonas alkenigignens]KTB48412.1 Response regulators consisting of a CheY-like receiver domain and a winged-helix DNA-binding domain [Dehalogenimonas alkenigignens]
MFNILILAEENDKTREIKNRLSREGYVCLLMPPGEEPEKLAAQHTARLVVVDVSAEDDIPTLDTAGEGKGPMLVAAVFRQRMAELGARDDVDDFVLKPFDVDELLTRIRKLAARAKATPPSDIIVAGDLIIDTARCEVSLAGAPIELTFREYELLKFLATNRGRVFSREVLLNKVWGYEYFGGDRTVDVHVRRLRSKIEEFGQVYVETVRNIGYRFKRNL